MESAISWIALLGGLALAGVAIGVLAWAFVKAAGMATRRPYWLIERNQAGIIVNAPKLESRIAGLESWQQTEVQRDGAVGPEWGDANPDADVDVDENDRKVGERG